MAGVPRWTDAVGSSHTSASTSLIQRPCPGGSCGPVCSRYSENASGELLPCGNTKNRLRRAHRMSAAREALTGARAPCAAHERELFRVELARLIADRAKVGELESDAGALVHLVGVEVGELVDVLCARDRLRQPCTADVLSRSCRAPSGTSVVSSSTCTVARFSCCACMVARVRHCAGLTQNALMHRTQRRAALPRGRTNYANLP